MTKLRTLLWMVALEIVLRDVARRTRLGILGNSGEQPIRPSMYTLRQKLTNNEKMINLGEALMYLACWTFKNFFTQRHIGLTS